MWLLRHNHKGMIGRWYSQLVAFDLDITYVSGKSQLVADPLSRLFATVRTGKYDRSTNPGTLEASGEVRTVSALASIRPGFGSNTGCAPSGWTSLVRTAVSRWQSRVSHPPFDERSSNGLQICCRGNSDHPRLRRICHRRYGPPISVRMRDWVPSSGI